MRFIDITPAKDAEDAGINAGTPVDKIRLREL
jgi:hypothetical protein